MLIDQSIARIRAYRASRGWSILRFAKEAKLNESTIRHLDDDGWSPTVSTLRALEAVIPDGFQAPGKSSRRAKRANPSHKGGAV